MDIQEELSDMLLLKMLQAATRGTTDNDRVRAFKLLLTNDQAVNISLVIEVFQNASFFSQNEHS